MFIVETPTGFHGPFQTAEAASKWAKHEIPLAKWCIRPLVVP